MSVYEGGRPEPVNLQNRELPVQAIWSFNISSYGLPQRLPFHLQK